MILLITGPDCTLSFLFLGFHIFLQFLLFLNMPKNCNFSHQKRNRNIETYILCAPTRMKYLWWAEKECIYLWFQDFRGFVSSAYSQKIVSAQLQYTITLTGTLVFYNNVVKINYVICRILKQRNVQYGHLNNSFLWCFQDVCTYQVKEINSDIKVLFFYVKVMVNYTHDINNTTLQKNKHFSLRTCLLPL